MCTFMDAKIPVKMDHQGNCYRPIVDRIQDNKQILFQFADIRNTCYSRDDCTNLSDRIF
jgi:hypothetical protein